MTDVVLTKNERAFVYAQRVLAALTAAGATEHPRLTIYADASCMLEISERDAMRISSGRTLLLLAQEMLYSNRSMKVLEPGSKFVFQISSCDGLLRGGETVK